jgi:hypothetical protein
MSIGNGFNAIAGALTYFKSARNSVITFFKWGTPTPGKVWGTATTENWG